MEINLFYRQVYKWYALVEMLFGTCYYQVVLLLAHVGLVVNNKTSIQNDKHKTEEGVIFAEVIKNITRVNNVLQELIKNYEKLQKMSKGNSLETDYSTDSEIDEVFKNNNYKDSKRRPRSKNERVEVTYPPTKRAFPGTEMLMSEEEPEISTEEPNYNEVISNRTPPIQSLQAALPVKTNEVKDTDSDDDFKGKDGDHIDHKHSDEVKVPDNVSYDNVHLNTTTKKAKSKRSKSKNHKHKRNSGGKTYLTTKENVQGNARNVQKVVYSESFHQGKIWDEIVNKKPIQLRAHKYMPVETKRDMRGQDGLLSAARPKKTAIVIVSKNKNMKPVSEESSFSLTEEEKEINKEEFKSRILRMAYGDACLKVVVKKCYKALKLVGKQVCRNIKCKSDFKEKYNQLTRLGCIGQFRVNATTATTNEPEGNYENNENYDYNQDFTIDPTRSGLEACYPLMETKHVTLRNETPHQTLDLRVDILRDRFERACQQASQAKCNDACKFAYQGACDEYECTKAKKKAFAKRCKAQCKAAYIIKKEKEKDSSDSSSDSDSESDSSDSDSDDWKV